MSRVDDFPFQLYLKDVYQQLQTITDGNVADYIPELSKVEPDLFGISLVTVDGAVQQIGDVERELTVQSISKPFIYGLVLDDLGVEAVNRFVNHEPSGDAFNSISLESGNGRPLNPMINAGAIAITGHVKGINAEDRFARIQDTLSQFAGRHLSLDVNVYDSEKKTGHKNRAIAHMLRNFDIVETDPELNLDLYFKQCSILANCNDLAVMAATLANDGINPVTKKRVLKSELVPRILSMMSMCGMYDYSGRWIYEIGLPAKSGVSGGTIVVLPGQFGLAIYSPRLDTRGNSVRGILVCHQLVSDFGLHMFHIPKIAQTVIRSNFTIKNVRSKRLRNEQEKQILDEKGDNGHIFLLQGEIRFVSAETAVRAIYDAARIKQFVIVDFRRVSTIDAGASKLLATMFNQIRQSLKCKVIIVAPTDFTTQIDTHSQRFQKMDDALEWCENHIIFSVTGESQTSRVSLEQNELCQGMSDAQINVLKQITQQKLYQPGDFIIHAGQNAENIFFLIDGQVSVRLHHNSGDNTRIATFSSGMFFGEMVLLGQTIRTADVIADSNVECYVLPVSTINALNELDQNLKVHMLENIAKRLAKNLMQSNMEITALNE